MEGMVESPSADRMRTILVRLLRLKNIRQSFAPAKAFTDDDDDDESGREDSPEPAERGVEGVGGSREE